MDWDRGFPPSSSEETPYLGDRPTCRGHRDRQDPPAVVHRVTDRRSCWSVEAVVGRRHRGARGRRRGRCRGRRRGRGRWGRRARCRRVDGGTRAADKPGRPARPRRAGAVWKLSSPTRPATVATTTITDRLMGVGSVGHAADSASTRCCRGEHAVAVPSERRTSLGGCWPSARPAARRSRPQVR